MNWLKKILGKKPPSLPDTNYWNAYKQAFEQDYTKKTLIRDIRFVVLDTETTGLDVKQDKLLSIGAVAVKNRKIHIADRFEFYVRQQYEGGKDGIKVHGILPKHNLSAQSAKNILIELLSYLQNSVLVGHHIGFDFAVLNRAFHQHLNGQLLNPTLDTAHLAQRIQSPFYQTITNNNEQLSLDELCHQYKVPIYNRHTAGGDALITALLFVKLLGKLEKKGVEDWGSLLRKGLI